MCLRKNGRMGETQQTAIIEKSLEELVRNREQSYDAIGRGRYVVKDAYCGRLC